MCVGVALIVGCLGVGDVVPVYEASVGIVGFPLSSKWCHVGD